MTPLPNLGSSAQTGNPLTVLNEHLGSITTELTRIRTHLEGSAELPHVPAIAKHKDAATWGVFCLGCSRPVGEYVFPCRNMAWEPMPPDLVASVSA